MKNLKRSHASIGVIALSALFFFMLASAPFYESFWTTRAQDPAAAPTPTPDEELDRAKREAALSDERAKKAENEKRIVEAKKGEFEARYPKPSTSPLSGTTTVEGAVIESQIISYRALRRAADRIVETIVPKVKESNLAVFNERDVNLILSYRVAEDQISLLQLGYLELLPTPTPTPVPGASATPSPSPSPSFAGPRKFAVPSIPAGMEITKSFLGAFVDMTALLRTNVDIKGQTFTIDEGPLVAEVFRAGDSKMGQLYYPYVFPIGIYGAERSELLGHLEDTRKLRVDAEKLFDDLAKTMNDLGETRDAIEKFEKVIIPGIKGQTESNVLLAGNIIKAHCPRLNKEVESIKGKPKEEWAAEMITLIERSRKSCVRMNRNKLETLLGLADTLNQLVGNLQKADTKLAEAKTKETRLELELLALESKLNLGITGSTDLDKVAEHADTAIARLKGLNAQFDSLVAALIEGEVGGSNALTNYIRIERLTKYVTASDFWLVLKVINAGGNNRIDSNLIADIFRGGSRVSHSGGVIVHYQLFNSGGQSICSGVVTEYVGYVDARKIPTDDKGEEAEVKRRQQQKRNY